MRGRNPLLLLLALCSLLLGSVATARAAECIGMVPAGGGPFWREVRLGAQRASAELGLKLYYRGPSQESRVSAQLQVIERVVALGCKALVIAPGGEAIGARVDQLQAKGIPTIYLDRDLASGKALALVATDNFAAGRRAGQHMAQLLNGRGRVALLRLRVGLNSTSERERGFRQGAEAGGLQVRVDTYVGEDSQRVVQVLQAQLGQLDGLFTPNNSTSRAALAAMRRMHKAGQLVHIGFDGDDVLMEALRLGDIHALLVQRPQDMGYQAVQLAHAALRGQLGQPRLNRWLDARLITRANMLELHDELAKSPAEP